MAADAASAGPLIGQQNAAAAVHAALERAFTIGRGTLVIIEGTPGAGKTRLLEHARNLALGLHPGARIYAAGFRDAGTGDRYAPISRIVRERFDLAPVAADVMVRGQLATRVAEAIQTVEAGEVVETTHMLGHVAGVPFPDSPFLLSLENRPAELHARACRALRRLVEGEAQRQPVLLLLDDMHSADPAAWTMAAEVARAEAHVAVVIACEPLAKNGDIDVPADVDTHIVRLGALREEDVAAFLHLLIPDLIAAPDALVAALTHRTGGHPGTLRELIADLLESDLFVQTPVGTDVDLGKLEEGRLPVTLDDAIIARLARLTATEKDTLARAAVVGDVFWDAALVAQIRSELPTLGTVADPLTLWPEDDTHARVAEILDRLERKGFIETQRRSDLPGTLERAFRLPRTRAILYDSLDPSVRTARHHATARWLMAVGAVRREGVAAMIAPHLERAGLPTRAGRAYLEAAAHERAKFHTTTALRYIEKALPLIAPDDIVRKIDALHEHGSLLTTVGRYDEAFGAFAEMLRLAWSIGARGKGGAAFNRMARVHQMRGEDHAAERLLFRALDLFRAAGDMRGVASSLDDLAQLMRTRGELAQAKDAANEALGIRRSYGDLRGEALSLNTLGLIELAFGNLDAAEQCLRDGLRAREQLGDLEGIVQSYRSLGSLFFERGDIDGATDAWRAALRHARQTANRRDESLLLHELGQALLAQKNLDEAEEHLTTAQGLAASLGDKRLAAHAERGLGQVAFARGDERASELLVSALRLAEDYGGREAIALAHRALAELHAQTLFDAERGVDRTAEESYLAAIDAFRNVGNDREAARTLADLGRLLIETGEIDTARERLGEARAMMRKLGLAEAQRVESLLEQLPAPDVGTHA